jgi:hypothetical protein
MDLEHLERLYTDTYSFLQSISFLYFAVIMHCQRALVCFSHACMQCIHSIHVGTVCIKRSVSHTVATPTRLAMYKFWRAIKAYIFVYIKRVENRVAAVTTRVLQERVQQSSASLHAVHRKSMVCWQHCMHGRMLRDIVNAFAWL